MLNKLAEP